MENFQGLVVGDNDVAVIRHKTLVSNWKFGELRGNGVYCGIPHSQGDYFANSGRWLVMQWKTFPDGRAYEAWLFKESDYDSVELEYDVRYHPPTARTVVLEPKAKLWWKAIFG